MITITKNNYEPLNQIVKKYPNLFIFYPNIFDQKTNITITDILISLKYDKNSQICFTSSLPLFLKYIKTDLEKITGHLFNSCLITKYNDNTPIQLGQPTNNKHFINPLLFFGDTRKIEYTKTNNNNYVKYLNINGGSLLLKQENIKMSFVTTSKTSFSILFKQTPVSSDLTVVYLNNKHREQFVKLVKNSIKEIHTNITIDFNVIKKYINIDKLIGKGDWGNVFSVCSNIDKSKICYAIKMSRITKDDLEDPFSDNSSSWYEIFILKYIIKKIILKNMCPNFPLFIDTCLCNNYDFTFRKGNQCHPSIMIAIELANGDLSDFLNFNSPSDKELYSALFQIMAAVHALQIIGQILNNDIKSKNILYYNVKPGGFWHYKIDEHNFYVPNYGKMFILNDFGVSSLYNPSFRLYKNKYQYLFNLGSRYAININETFSPINAEFEFIDNNLQKTTMIKWLNNETSNSATYKLNRKTNEIVTSNTVLSSTQKSYLIKKGITTDTNNLTFFQHPTVIPPFEFYNDTQDTLRMFVGGKRTTQKGNHKLNDCISKNFQNSIKPYLGNAENAKQKQFSNCTYHVLAGSFIKKFFTETCNFKLKPQHESSIIDFFNMNISIYK
jgi:hypothetical protein